MTNLKFSVNKIIDYCCVLLIILIFVSKVSLKWTFIIPYSINPFIFQYGLHPIINFSIQGFLFLILFFYWSKNKSHYPLAKPYKILIFTLIAILSIQTLFQITLVNITQPILTQLGGLGMAIILVLLYGVIIPSVFSLDKFISLLRKISVTLVVLSVVMLPFLFPYLFRGGRFIGVFKHIPHMVTASTTAFIFYFPKLFQDKKWTLKDNFLIHFVCIFLLFLAVVLTSTKAAIATIAIAALIGILFFGNQKRSARIFKFTFVASVLLTILLIGAPLSKFIYDVSTGQVGFGMRPAQDGVSSRMEEIYRGLEIFERSPYFGHGLMYKYFNGNGEEAEVDSYNSFKDPHNFFVSSGVIGGFPLMIYSVIAYLVMIYAVWKGLKEKDANKKILALFLLAHLPVFIVYHANFSIGGMGDRIYWLVFGYLGQDWFKPKPVT